MKSNISPLFDGDSLQKHGSLVMPHFIQPEIVDEWAQACNKLRPTDTIGGGVPEFQVLSKPSLLQSLRGPRKQMIDKFVMPFLDKVGVDRRKLLQVSILANDGSMSGEQAAHTDMLAGKTTSWLINLTDVAESTMVLTFDCSTYLPPGF